MAQDGNTWTLRFARGVVQRRRSIAGLLVVVTLFFAYPSLNAVSTALGQPLPGGVLSIGSDARDLVPDHPFIHAQNKFAGSFGNSALVAIAMVSQFNYVHLMNRYVRGRAPFATMLKAVIIGLLLIVDPRWALAAGFVWYAMSAPVMAGYRWAAGRPAIIDDDDQEEVEERAPVVMHQGRTPNNPTDDA